MSSNFRPTSASQRDAVGQPFASAAEAWFWYMACHQARIDGARVVAGRSAVARPCEPADIHLATLKLLQSGRLRPHHLRIMVRYGRIMMAPDPSRSPQLPDCALWREAMAELAAMLMAKGIVA
jgi:hypothetical protein